MGLFDSVKNFVTGEKPKEKKKKELKEGETPEATETTEQPEIDAIEGTSEKYAGNQCALCQGENPDKKWAGQYWHKQCYRRLRKTGKTMI